VSSQQFDTKKMFFHNFVLRKQDVSELHEIYKTDWLLHASPTVILKNSEFLTQSVFMCCMGLEGKYLPRQWFCIERSL